LLVIAFVQITTPSPRSPCFIYEARQVDLAL
jgi:hypothetical protein